MVSQSKNDVSYMKIANAMSGFGAGRSVARSDGDVFRITSEGTAMRIGGTRNVNVVTNASPTAARSSIVASYLRAA